MLESWLSSDDIGVVMDTNHAWAADKAMPAHKVGRLWKFQTREVDRSIRGNGAADWSA